MESQVISSNPFFILGAQRSGTTMLRLMLNKHPNIAIPHETGFITVFYSELSRYGDLSIKHNQKKLLEDISHHKLVIRGKHITDKEKILSHNISNYSDLINAIFIEYAKSNNKKRWGDKTPFYTPDIDILYTLFPEAKFLHLVRDGRDVIISQRNISWMSNSVPRLAEEWKWKTTICSKVGKVLGTRKYLEIKYEDLVISPEVELKKICKFFNEEYDERILRYSDDAKNIVPNESLKWHQNSVQTPDKNKISKWKNILSKSDRIIFEQIAGSTLKEYGYELENMSSNIYSKIKSVYYSLFVRW